MATNTYVELDKITVGSAVAFVTLNSINQGYTDLILVCNIISSTNVANYVYLQYNGDTGSNYSTTIQSGNGSSPVSTRFVNRTNFNIDYYATPRTEAGNRIVQIQNYSNTTTFKTGLLRANRAGGGTDATVGLWRSTAPITSITVTCDSDTFAAGTTFSLYGIKAWAPETTPKATGGYVYEDSTYWYHAFPFSSTFTPNQSLACDYVVVAGGAGGGGSYGGGGGAGGLRYATSQSLSATGYTVTVGAGGVGQINYNGTAPTNGSTSSFNSMNTTGGGRGGIFGTDQAANGGSGGGSRRTATSGGSGNAGGYTPVEGYAGGGGYDGTNYGSGGGGGAGQAGTNGTATAGGKGGDGFSSSLITAIVSATQIGQLVSGTGYLAGGGGGGTYDGGTFGAGGLGGGGKSGNALSSDASLQNGESGAVSTGSGGGGGCYSNITATNFNGGNGGSGVVIIRYAKV